MERFPQATQKFRLWILHGLHRKNFPDFPKIDTEQNMRKWVVASSIFLAFSGGFLYFLERFAGARWAGILATLHIWVGIFFVVIFPMYAWEHIQKNRRRLKRISWVSVSGVIQVVAGAGLILSGVILLLYGAHRLAFSTEAHFHLTYLFSISLSLHFLIKK